MNQGVRDRFGLGITNCRPASDVLAGIELAERLGAEIAFVAEDINCRDAFQLCALAAERTHRIQLATGVTNPYTRNPTALAMSISTLDETSGGRAVLGLGSSSPSLIEVQMGIPHRNSATVMREAVTILRALLRGEEVSFEGERFRYREAHLHVPVARPIPIFFAAMGPQMLRLAGRIADGVLLNVGATTSYVRWAVRQVEQGAEDAGRDPSDVTIAAWHTVYIGDDREVGLRRARAWLATMLSIPRQGELLLEHAGGDPGMLEPIRRAVSAYPHSGNAKEAAEYIPDEIAERMTLIGTAEEVQARLQEYREAGVQLPVLSIGAIGALYAESME